ncbi:Calx-beta domain protein [Planctomycetes bacterium Pan216]|uniref:Calx-beta domain protein n=1 Tax=Kolteria novifilia TaxID=2527975 RepID=A0A518BAU3_9BACT|nr:Calx-beta domain protein [Planctomycetes bacterium Pan216]
MLPLTSLMFRRPLSRLRRFLGETTPRRSTGRKHLLETLEDRSVPASLVVTAGDDISNPNDSDLSLREAIEAAEETPESDTITFAQDVETVMLGQADTNVNLGPSAFVITTEITIQGGDSDSDGAPDVTIQRDPATTANFRLFAITPTGNLTLNGVTLAGGVAKGGDGDNGGGGAAGMGGAIFNQGTLTLQESLLTGNEARGGSGGSGSYGGGGGIAGSSSGMQGGPPQSESGFGSGGASGTSGGFGGGGGGGAPTSNGGNGGFGGGGGGGSSFLGSPTQPGIGGFGGSSGNSDHGGGGAGMGGAIFNHSGTVDIDQTRVENNLAQGGSGSGANGQGLGGGIFNLNGEITLADTAFTGNQALTASGFPMANGGSTIYNRAQTGSQLGPNHEDVDTASAIATVSATVSQANLLVDDNDTLVASEGGGSAQFEITVVNTAPVLTDADHRLSAIRVNFPSADIQGDSVADILVDNSITDSDGLVEAIAITGVDNTNGTWQHWAGTEWTDISDTSGQIVDLTSDSLLLGPDDQLRFVPNAEFVGTPSLSFRAWDQSTGAAFDRVDLSAPEVLGGETAFSAESDEISIDVLPVVSIAAASTTIQEGDSGPFTVELTVTLSHPVDEEIFVPVATINGLAVSDVDFDGLDFALSFNAGNQLDQTINATINGDTLFEGDETFSVALSEGDGFLVDESASSVQLTILDDDPAPVSFAPSSAVLDEVGNPLSITASIPAAIEEEIVVQLAYSGSAVRGADFNAPLEVTIAAGSTAATIDLTGIPDDLFEGDANESIIITPSTTATGAFLADENPFTLSLQDNESTPSVLLRVPTGNTDRIAEQGGRSQVSIALSHASVESVTVELAFGGTATLVDDFLVSGITFTIPAGQTERLVDISALADATIEGNETIEFAIANVDNAVDDRGRQLRYTITEDISTLPLAIELDHETFAEDGEAILTVHRTLPTDEEGNPVAIDEQIRLEFSGSADWTSDYVIVGEDDAELELLDDGSLTLAFGESDTRTLRLRSIDDTELEDDETIVIGLPGIQQIEAMIIDDDDRVLSVEGIEVNEGDEGSSVATFTVSLNLPWNEEVTVNYQTIADTATEGSDYEAVSGTLTFAPGETERTVEVPILGDQLVELDERFSLSLSNPLNAIVDASQSPAQAMIVNDDVATIAWSSVVVDEADGVATIIATLDRAVEAFPLLLYTTGDDTAQAGVDFEAVTNSLPFTEGPGDYMITIPIIDDAIAEPEKSFLVHFVSLDPQGRAVEFTSESALVTILDDDVAGVSVTPGAINMTEGGSTELSVVLGSQPTSDVVITLNPDSQLRTNATEVLFTPDNWDTPQLVPLSVFNDSSVEGNHQGVLSLTVSSDDSNYGDLALDSVVVSITDNDRRTPTQTPAPPTSTRIPETIDEDGTTVIESPDVIEQEEGEVTKINGLLDLKSGAGEVEFQGDVLGSGTIRAVDQRIRLRGRVTPGEIAGTLSFEAERVEIESGSEFEYEYGRDAQDALAIEGAVQIDAGAHMVLERIAPERLTAGNRWVAIHNDGDDLIDGEFDNVAEGELFLVDGALLQASYQGGDGNDLSFLVVASRPDAIPSFDVSTEMVALFRDGKFIFGGGLDANFDNAFYVEFVFGTIGDVGHVLPDGRALLYRPGTGQIIVSRTPLGNGFNVNEYDIHETGIVNGQLRVEDWANRGFETVALFDSATGRILVDGDGDFQFDLDRPADYSLDVSGFGGDVQFAAWDVSDNQTGLALYADGFVRLHDRATAEIDLNDPSSVFAYGDGPLDQFSMIDGDSDGLVREAVVRRNGVLSIANAEDGTGFVDRAFGLSGDQFFTLSSRVIDQIFETI